MLLWERGNYKVMNMYNCQCSHSITISKSIQQLRLREKEERRRRREREREWYEPRHWLWNGEAAWSQIGKHKKHYEPEQTVTQLRVRKSAFHNWISVVKRAEQHILSQDTHLQEWEMQKWVFTMQHSIKRHYQHGTHSDNHNNITLKAERRDFFNYYWYYNIWRDSFHIP